MEELRCRSPSPRHVEIAHLSRRTDTKSTSRSTPTHRRPNNKHHVVRSWLFDLTDNGTIGLSTTKDAASPTARLKHAPIHP